MHKPMTISVFPLTQNQNVTYLTYSSTKYTCTSELNFELHLSQKPGDRIFFMTLLSSIEVTHSIDILKKIICLLHSAHGSSWTLDPRNATEMAHGRLWHWISTLIEITIKKLTAMSYFKDKKYSKGLYNEPWCQLHMVKQNDHHNVTGL